MYLRFVREASGALSAQTPFGEFYFNEKEGLYQIFLPGEDDADDAYPYHVAYTWADTTKPHPCDHDECLVTNSLGNKLGFEYAADQLPN